MSLNSGDLCPNKDCGGRLHFRSSQNRDEVYVRYLKCARCGADCGKVVVPASAVRKRYPV